MFGVDAILLSWLLLPLAKRLSDDVVDGAYQWLIAQGVTLGANLAQKIDARSATSEDLASGVGEFIEEHPEAATRLATAALREGAGGAMSEEEFLQVLLGFLMGVFELVNRLGHPAVLTGFLTGKADLAVIDVRTVNDDEALKNPTVSAYGSNAPRIGLADRGFGYTPNRIPRIWLLTPEDGEGDEIRKLANAAGVSFEWPGGAFEDFMRGRPLVSAITANEVVLENTQVSPGGFSVPAARDVTEVPWDHTPDGLIAMRDELREVVGAQEMAWNEMVATWTTALAA
jgi:hypothetical protein